MMCGTSLTNIPDHVGCASEFPAFVSEPLLTFARGRLALGSEV